MVHEIGLLFVSRQLSSAYNMSYQVLRDPDSGEPVLFLGQKRLTYSEVSLEEEFIINIIYSIIWEYWYHFANQFRAFGWNMFRI